MNLVTGATGILGSHVLYRLMLTNEPVIAARRAGSNLDDVKTLFRFYTGSDEMFHKICWTELDITDSGAMEDLVEKADTVYHCAGFVSFDSRDRNKMMKTNDRGTATVVNACLLKNKILCHVSSVAVLHNLDYKQPLDESVFWKKSGRESDYAISKYNAEREVWRGTEEGLKAVIVNPGLIIAPGFWQRSSMKLFTRTYEGNRFYTGGILATVGAMDVASVMIKLVDEKRFGQRYILVEGNHSYKTVLDTFAGALGKKAPDIQVGPVLLRLVSWFEKVTAMLRGRRAELTEPVMSAAFNRQLFSSSKVASDLGFSFTPLQKLAEEAALALRGKTA